MKFEKNNLNSIVSILSFLLSSVNDTAEWHASHSKPIKSDSKDGNRDLVAGVFPLFREFT